MADPDRMGKLTRNTLNNSPNNDSKKSHNASSWICDVISVIGDVIAHKICQNAKIYLFDENG
jgi:hypothetical protein